MCVVAAPLRLKRVQCVFYGAKRDVHIRGLTDTVAHMPTSFDPELSAAGCYSELTSGKTVTHHSRGKCT